MTFLAQLRTSASGVDVFSCARLVMFVATLVAVCAGSASTGRTQSATALFTSLYQFPSGSAAAGDATPATDLTLGSDTFLHGATQVGGENNAGAVFRYKVGAGINPDRAFVRRASFDELIGGTNYFGANPVGPFLEASPGNFFGVATDGGTNGTGTVFEFADGTLTLVYSFDPADGNAGGMNPNALVADGAGNLYGTARNGGSSGVGTIFEISPGNVFTLLYTFAGGSLGANPDALIRDAAGNLYGTTYAGGLNNTGTLFQLTPAGAFNILHHFSPAAPADAEGAFPTSLVQGGDLNLYGTAAGGGEYGNGTIFEVSADGVSASALHSFATPSANPVAPLLLGSDHNFYGTTSQGGAYSFGSVFQLSSLGRFSSLHDFTGADGSYPLGRLAETPGGYLYGATSAGGALQAGTIFSLELPPTITSTPSGSGQVAVPFLYQITATFQPTGYKAGPLPPGLFLDAVNGTISGTPTLASSYALTLSAVNAGGTSAGIPLTLTILPPAIPVIISTGTTAQVGQPIGYVIAATNLPTRFSAVGLPAGLSLDTQTGEISGTPMMAGTFTAAISASNISGTATAPFTFTITRPPQNIQAVTILSPSTDINIVLGETITLAVAVTALPNTLASVVLEAYNAPGTPAGDTILARSTFSRTSETWTPPALGISSCG